LRVFDPACWPLHYHAPNDCQCTISVIAEMLRLTATVPVVATFALVPISSLPLLQVNPC